MVICLIGLQKLTDLPMLSNEEILLIIANQRHDVPIDIVTEFTDSRSTTTLNRRIFKAKLLPVAPSLCFFEQFDNQPGYYGMSSFFSGVEANYTLVPFGQKKIPSAPEQDLGISYNAFYNNLPLQSYTICKDNDDVPKRVSNQGDFFKETNCNPTMWSAGHLIAHRYTPLHTQPSKA